MNGRMRWGALALLCLTLLSGSRSGAQTTPTIATLVSPTNLATNISSPTTFSWSAVPAATVYYLYVGTTPGAKDVIDSGETTATWLVHALTSGTYYARLHTLTGGVWYYAPDVTFTVVTSLPAAVLASPTDGSTQVNPATQLRWNAMANATAYAVLIGTAAGQGDVFQSGQIAPTAVSVQLQPATKYYVQLQTYYGSNVVASLSSFVTAATQATLISPVNGATQVPLNPVFSWAATTNAGGYRLDIGSQIAQNDIYSSGTLSPGTTQLNCNLPKGGTYYVRLWTQFFGTWYSSDSSFSSGTFSVMTNPVDGAIHVSPNLTFSWSSVPDTQGYFLYVGSSWRSKDVFSTGQTQATQASFQLALGKRYYATIWTLTGGVWVPSDISFVTDTGYAQMVYPSDGATNIATQAAFGWSAISDATSYQISIGSATGLNDVYSRGAIQTNTASIPNLQAQTHYYVHLTTLKAGMTESVDSSFTTGTNGTGLATMLYPVDGASGVDPTQPFTWTFISDAQKYYLTVGSAPGKRDVFDSGELTSTSIILPPGNIFTGKYYVTLYTLKGGVWQPMPSTFVAGDRSSISSPLNGATEVDPLAPITWTTFPGAQSYYLYVGTSPGLKNVYDSAQTTDTQRSVPNLQASVQYYARIYTLINGFWIYSDSSFTVGTGFARLIQPADGTLTADGNAPFVWSSVPDAQYYYLTIGSSQGARDIYDNGQTTATAAFVAGLTPNRTYYVRLYTDKSSGWHYVDSTFQIIPTQESTASSLLNPISPFDGDTAVDPLSAASWTPVPGATSYVLHIGTTPGAWDVYDSGEITTTTVLPAGLQYGASYDARLWVNVNNIWSYTDIDFQTEPLSAVANLSQVESTFYANVYQATANVRLTTQYPTNVPIAGTQLAALVSSYGGTSASCPQFAAALIPQLKLAGAAGRIRNITLTGTNYESHTTVEFYDPFLNKWVISDPTFGVTFSNIGGGGLSVDEISSLANQGQFTAVIPKFLTQYGQYYINSYYLDIITVFANVLPAGAGSSSLGPQPNPADPYLTAQSLSAITGIAGTYIVKFQNSSDTVILNNGSQQITLSPLNGTSWSRSIMVGFGWSVQTSSPAAQFFTFKRIMF